MHGTGLLDKVGVVKTFDHVATGTTDSNSIVVDMQNSEGAVFTTIFGTSATDNGVKAQQGDLANGSDMSDLEGSQLLLDGTQTTAALEIHKPRKRYVRVVALRGTTTTVEAGSATVYGKRTYEFPQDADTAAKSVVSPDEGTP